MSSLPRNVILDLLPAYIAGEASEETRALVDEFAQNDPQIARLIRSGTLDAGLTRPAAAPPADVEVQAVKRMRHRIRNQGWHLGLAIACSAMAISFQWDSNTGFRWTMQELPLLGILLGLLALFFWVKYFRSRSLNRAHM